MVQWKQIGKHRPPYTVPYEVEPPAAAITSAAALRAALERALSAGPGAELRLRDSASRPSGA